MRGRPPTPAHLQVLTGGAGAARTAPAGGADHSPEADQGLSVNIESGVPFCPEPVRENKDAQEIWERLVALLVPAGLMSPIYEGTLMGYCIAYARLVEAERKLRDAGVAITDRSRRLRSGEG